MDDFHEPDTRALPTAERPQGAMDADGATDPVPDDGGDRFDTPLVRLLLVVFVGGVLALLDATIVNVGIDTVGRALHTPLTVVQWVNTGYLLAVAVAMPITGWAVDRFGDRPVWLLGLGVFTLGSALSGLAWSPASLIVFRIFQGFGGGMVQPTMLTLSARAAGPRRAGRAIGVMAMTSTVGPVLGPVLGGLILAHLDWRWIFLVNVPVGLVAIALALRFVPRPTPAVPSARHRLDLIGTALLCPGFAALVYALSRAGEEGFTTTGVPVALAAGAALLTGYVVHALRTGHMPIIDLRLFANRAFTASVAVMFLVGGALFSLMFLLPLYWQQVHHHGVLDTGLLLVPFGLGTLVGMPCAGRLSDRLGARRLVPVGAILVALGALGYAGASSASAVPVLLVCAAMAGVGLGFVGAPTMSSVYRTVPPASVSAATGAIVVVRQLGASLGIAVVTLVLAHETAGGAASADAFGTAFRWVVGGGVLVALAAFCLPGRPARPASSDA